jgi:hypothetical protein
MKHTAAIVAVIAAFACFSSGAVAQDPGPGGILQDLGGKPQGPLEVRYAKLETWMEEKVRVTVLSGGVVMTQADVTIECDSLVGWFDESKSGPPSKPGEGAGETAPAAESKPSGSLQFQEVYAEGSVRMLRGKKLIQASKLYYNLETGTGCIADAKVMATQPDGRTGVVIRAKMIRQVNAGRYDAEDASITTCTLGDPHWEIKVKGLGFDLNDEGDMVTLKYATPTVGGIPVFFIPFYRASLGKDSPLRGLRFSDTRRFGRSVKAIFGVNINRYERDESGKVLTDQDGNPRLRKWGEVLIKTDYFQKRGIGKGADVNYQWDGYQGNLVTYHIRDRGPDGSTDYDKRFLPLDHHDRGRVDFFHRQTLAEGLRADVEASYFSDRNFREEFYSTEYKNGKEPETYIYLRYLHENFGATALARNRVNGYQTQTEYMPQIGANLVAQPIFGGGAYVSGYATADNVRVLYDEALDEGADRILRFDTYQEVAAPFRLFGLSAEPFAGMRFSEFEETVASGNSTERFIGTAGLRTGLQAQRVYDWKSEKLGLDQMKHIAGFFVRYATNYNSDEPSTELYQFDSIDRADEFTEVAFEMTHRFQTKAPDSETPIEFLQIGMEMEFYPDSTRDTRERRDANWLYPMNWMMLKADKDGEYDRRHFSNLRTDIAFTPKGRFSVLGAMEYDTHEGALDFSTFTVNIQAAEDITFYAGQSYNRHSVHSVNWGCDVKLSDKWGFAIAQQYDFEQHQLWHQSYTLRRDMHDFLFEIMMELDAGQDEKRFLFMISPLWSGQSKLRISPAGGL